MRGFNRFLQYTIYTGIGAVLLVVPFVVTSSMFFPFITGKNILFRILVAVMTGAWLLLAHRKPSYRPKRSWILWSVLALLIIIGVADIFGVNPTKAFWSNFERMDGYITLLHFGLFVFVTASVLNTQKLWNAFLNTTVGASAIMGGYALLQIAGLITINQGGVRVDGTFGNATYLAVYMLFHIFLTLLLLVRYQGKQSVRWLYGAAIVLQVFILMKTATRGAMLGLFGGLVLTALLVALFEKERVAIKKSARNGLIVLVILAGLFFALKNTAVVQNVEPLRRLASISLEEGTVRSRLTLWSSTAWNGFKERPVLGWGQEGFGVVFAKHYDPDMYDQEPWFDRAHNVFLDWLIAGGVLGLAAYLLLFGTALYYLWFNSPRALGESGKPRNTFDVVEKSILTGLLAGYFFHNLFVFDNVMSYILFGLVLAYIHARSRQMPQLENKKEKEIPVGNTALIYASYIAVPILVIVSVYTLAIRPALGARSLINSLRQQETLSDNLAHFEKTFSYRPITQEETLLQLFQMTNGVVANPNIPNETKQVFATFAIQQGNAYSEKIENDVRHELFFSIFLMRIGLFDQAEQHLTRALGLSPNKQQILNTAGQFYLATENTQEALSFFKKAYEVAPQFDGPAAAYAAALIRTGNTEEAEGFLMERFETLLVPHPEIINAYASVGNSTRLRDLWEARVALNPEDAQAHLGLAAALVELGQTSEAREHALKAVQLDPSLIEQAEQIVGEIQTPENTTE